MNTVEVENQDAADEYALSIAPISMESEQTSTKNMVKDAARASRARRRLAALSGAEAAIARRAASAATVSRPLGPQQIPQSAKFFRNSQPSAPRMGSAARRGGAAQFAKWYETFCKEFGPFSAVSATIATKSDEFGFGGVKKWAKALKPENYFNFSRIYCYQVFTCIAGRDTAENERSFGEATRQAVQSLTARSHREFQDRSRAAEVTK